MTVHAEVVPEKLAGLSGEERMRIHEMPRLEARPGPEGHEVSGIFRTDRTTGRRRFDGTKQTELRFHVLLTEDGTQ